LFVFWFVFFFFEHISLEKAGDRETSL